MIFNETEAIERLKKPLNEGAITEGRKYESRLRLFTESKFEKSLDSETSWKEFIEFMETTIKKKKAARVRQFIQYPLSSVNITEALMSDLYKVFDAGNSYFNVETVKKNGGEALLKLLAEVGINKWMEEKGKEVLKNKPNTVVVVDKDEEGNPYLLAIDNDRLIDMELKENGVDMEYVVFLHSLAKNEEGKEIKKIALYDDEIYYVFIKDEDKYTVETQAPHNIGYCPARMYVREKLNSKEKFSRRSPLALVLGKLQEWQYFDIYKYYTDHYAPFPITEMVRSQCGNDQCKDGWVHIPEVYYSDNVLSEKIQAQRCPVCEENNDVGLGAKILLDPVEEGETDSTSGKFRMISHDISNLDYLGRKLVEIETYIKLKVVGQNEILTKEAVNKDQVKGSMETSENVLLGLKENLDILYVWITQTLANALKGAEQDIHISANFGTEWYLVTEEQLRERYENAMKAGLPRFEVDMIYNQYIETKYKGNPKKLYKLKLVNDIDPIPHENFDTKFKLSEMGLISKEELVISERLITFVNRFERENGSIVDFGENLELEKKQSKILEIIKKYANENIEPST